MVLALNCMQHSKFHMRNLILRKIQKRLNKYHIVISSLLLAAPVSKRSIHRHPAAYDNPPLSPYSSTESISIASATSQIKDIKIFNAYKPSSNSPVC